MTNPTSATVDYNDLEIEYRVINDVVTLRSLDHRFQITYDRVRSIARFVDLTSPYGATLAVSKLMLPNKDVFYHWLKYGVMTA